MKNWSEKFALSCEDFRRVNNDHEYLLEIWDDLGNYYQSCATVEDVKKTIENIVKDPEPGGRVVGRIYNKKGEEINFKVEVIVKIDV